MNTKRWTNQTSIQVPKELFPSSAEQLYENCQKERGEQKPLEVFPETSFYGLPLRI